MSARRYLLLPGFLILAGCSNQEMYEGLQRRNVSDCYRLPVAQQQDCLDRAREVSYEEYEREIKKAAE